MNIRMLRRADLLASRYTGGPIIQLGQGVSGSIVQIFFDLSLELNEAWTVDLQQYCMFDRNLRTSLPMGVCDIASFDHNTLLRVEYGTAQTSESTVEAWVNRILPTLVKNKV